MSAPPKKLRAEDAEVVRIVVEHAHHDTQAREARRMLADAIRLLDETVRRRPKPRTADRAVARRRPYRVDA